MFASKPIHINMPSHNSKPSNSQKNSIKIPCYFSSSPELHHLSTVAATASERGSQLTATSSTLGPSTLLSVDKRHSRLGESSPNLSRIHHTHTQLSLGTVGKIYLKISENYQ